MRFYDLKTKKMFETSEFKIVMKKGRKFAVAKSPSGITAYRIVSQDYK